MLQLFLVCELILLNGVLAMSELALVAARRSRLQAMVKAGHRGAGAALTLTDDPGRFLSTVQIGITLIRILAGALSGVGLGDHVAGWFANLGVPPMTGVPLGFGLVVVVVTYLSIVVGELAPKRLALRHAEQIACAMAPGMTLLTRATAPVGWLLNASTDLVFRLLGQTQAPEGKVTSDDVHPLIAEAERTGTIESAERHMISGVLQLADRPVRDVMTPRADVEWIDAAADDGVVRAVLMQTTHSRLLVGDGSLDVILGVVKSREMLVALLAGRPLNIKASARNVPVVAISADALDVLAALRDAAMTLALVCDKDGRLEGLVTLADLTKVVVGAGYTGSDGTAAVQREDGSWFLAGGMPVQKMADLIGILLPSERTYHTVSGFVLAAAGGMLQVGEVVEFQAWRWEIVDLDGSHIDKLLVSPVRAEISSATRRPGSGPLPW